MARAFNPNEKLQIYESLLRSGCTLFGKNGFIKTNIDTITTEAGVAKGTFYHFWDSKEAFFFACLEETEQRFQEEVIEPLLSSDRHPAEVLGSLINEALKATDDYPMIGQALDPVLMNRLIRKLPAEILERHQEKDRGEFALIAASWNPEEFNPGIDPEVLDGLFKGILMMSLHKEIIGEDVFSRVSETMAAVISAGLKSISDENIAGKRMTK